MLRPIGKGEVPSFTVLEASDCFTSRATAARIGAQTKRRRSPPRMMFLVKALEALSGDEQVDLGGGETCMTKHHLHSA